MTDQPQPTVTWQPPEETTGPAPGLEFAGFGARLVAYIVDAIIVGIVIGVIAIILGAVIVGGATSNNAGVAGVGSGLLILVVLVVSLGYFPYFWSRSGATPGMRMLGLKVVRDKDGGPISTGQAVLRLIGYWVSSLVFYLGYIWIFIDKRRRGWHDLIAGTVVVKQS
jgi:uncharacterized RDD family membrane protein YckC